jgi:hypothetical protein
VIVDNIEGADCIRVTGRNRHDPRTMIRLANRKAEMRPKNCGIDATRAVIRASKRISELANDPAIVRNEEYDAQLEIAHRHQPRIHKR